MAKRKVVRRKKASYVPPKLPDSPSVTKGKSYGQTKRGWQLIARFQISCYAGRYGAEESDVWWVFDMQEGKIARGTNKKGYPKKEAKRIAEEFRDQYGAWARIPF